MMTKNKTLYLSLLVMLLSVFGTSCKDDNPIVIPKPTIENIEVSGAEADETGAYKLEIGQTITFKLLAKNVAEGKYEWYVNDEKQETTTETFAFTPKVIGEYVIKAKAANSENVQVEYAVGKVVVVPPAPIIDSFTRDQEDVSNLTEPIVLPSGARVDLAEEVTYEVKVSNTKVDYIWILNGDTLKNETNSVLKLATGRSGNVKVAVRNEVGVEASKSVNLQGEFNTGLFVYGMTYDGISFYDATKKKYFKGKDSSIFNTINHYSPEKQLKEAGGINDLYIHNNKVYILQASYKGYGVVTVADAQTLMYIKQVNHVKGFQSKLLGQIYNLVPAKDNKVYVAYNVASKGNTSAVGILDLDKETFEPVIEGTSGKLGVAGPNHSRMIRNGKDALVACGNKLQIIDTNTDKVIQSVSFNEARQVVDILKNNDEYIYLVVDGEKDKSSAFWLWGSKATTPASIVKINAKDYTIVEETELKDGDDMIYIKGGLSSGSAISPRGTNNPEIYIPEGGSYGASGIYAYNIESKKTRLLVKDFKKDIKGSQAFGGYLGTDKDGKLYVPGTNYMTSTVVPYKAAGGYPLESIGTCSGDCSVVGTWYFNY